MLLNILGGRMMQPMITARQVRIRARVAVSQDGIASGSGVSENGASSQNQFSSDTLSSVYKSQTTTNRYNTENAIQQVTAQRQAASQVFQNTKTGIEKLTSASSALGLGRALVQQARDLASTANDAGADRAWITSEVNDLLAQARDIVQGTTFAGKKLFRGVNPEIRMQSGISATSSFGVKLAGPQKVTQLDTNQPSRQWTKLIGGANEEMAKGLTIGTDGSIYVSGRSASPEIDGQGNNGDVDAFVTKFNLDGTKAWTQLLGGTAYDESYAMATAADGSVYAVGRSGSPQLDGQTSSGGGSDAFITKLNSDGSREWTRLFGNGNPGYVSIEAAAVASDGSIYGVGSWAGAPLDGLAGNGDMDVFIVKYSPDGTRQWTRSLGGTDRETGTAVTIGSDGSIFVGGFTRSAEIDGQGNNSDPNNFSKPLANDFSSAADDAFIAKYNPDGTKVWVKLIGGSDKDNAYALAAGTDGSVYLTGRTSSSQFVGQTNNGGTDGFLTRFNTDGVEQWTKLIGSSGSDAAFAVSIGADGGIFIGGSTTSPQLEGQSNSGGNDVFLSKFNSDGTKVWTSVNGGTEADTSRNVVVATDGKMYLSGGSYSLVLDNQTNNGDRDAFVAQFNPYSLSQTTTNSAFNGLTVDLSTQLSTSTALTNIDAALSYFTTASRKVSYGLARAHRTRSYLTSSMSLFDARLSRLRG